MIATVAIFSEDGKVHVRAPFQYKETCKALPGARWNPKTKTWYVPGTPAAAREVYDAFRHGFVSTDDTVRQLVEDARRAELAKQKVAREDLPPIPGKTDAWLHQRQAYHFVRDGRLKAAMLAMGMGTGKSRTAIGLVEGWDARLVLILCPKNVVGVWPKQFLEHSEHDWTVVTPPMKATVTKRAAFISRALGRRRRGERMVVVVNYDSAWRPAMKMVLLAVKWDVGILDESHRIKAPGGQTSKFCATLREYCDRRLCLTGTPMPHSPLDVYAQYRFLDPGVFGTSFTRFRAKYAVMGGYEGRQVVAYQNEPELSKKFGSISFVCDSDDVLDLPPYHHVERTFELDPKGRRAYATLEADLVLGVKEGLVTTKNALVKLLRLQQVTSGFVRDDDGTDHQVGTEKLDLLKEVLEDLKPTEPVVVFCRFQNDLDGIRHVTESLGRRYGELSGRSRDGLTADSTMSEDIDVLGVQEQAGGVGIDLTRAAYCIFYSLSFSLGDYEQALKRVHRPGQTRPTTYIHLVAKDTKDEVVYQALRQRKDVVQAVIDASKS